MFNSTCTCLLSLTLFFSFSLLEARQIEAAKISDIEKFINKESSTVYFFDIDNTIFHASQQIGRDQWFSYCINRYVKQGLAKPEALEKALKEWEAVQSITEVELLDEECAEVIKRMQNRNLHVIGLTTRGLGTATRTIDQLNRLNIHFAPSAPKTEEFLFNNGKRSVLFRGGVLFTAATSKGDAVKEFLRQAKLSPKTIVFINDKANNLSDVERMCERENIEFIGLRYSGSDKYVESFDAELALIQWEHFGKILSDSEAKSRVNK